MKKLLILVAIALLIFGIAMADRHGRGDLSEDQSDDQSDDQSEVQDIESIDENVVDENAVEGESAPNQEDNPAAQASEITTTPESEGGFGEDDEAGFSEVGHQIADWGQKGVGGLVQGVSPLAPGHNRECDSDTDCPGQQLCCNGICRQACVSPSPPDGVGECAENAADCDGDGICECPGWCDPAGVCYQWGPQCSDWGNSCGVSHPDNWPCCSGRCEYMPPGAYWCIGACQPYAGACYTSDVCCSGCCFGGHCDQSKYCA